MKWYQCKDSTRWGIEISKSGLVEQVKYEHGDDRRSYKREPKLAEELLTEDVLWTAFEAIFWDSKDGTDEIAHQIMGKDAETLNNIALKERKRCDAVIELLKNKF